MKPTFTSLSNTSGLEIIDPIETRRFVFLTSAPVTPEPAPTEGFTFPVTGACRIETASLILPNAVALDIRRPDGTNIASISPQANREFGADDYLIELHGPLKIYLRLKSGIRVDTTSDRIEILFDELTSVKIGARSYHSSPGSTITVPDDPEKVMAALSTFGSTIKTTSPERAWPTLRGHPPRLELGDELRIPDHMEPPETGVTIQIPAEYDAIYPIAPLAYYLGAEVVPGTPAVVTTDSGFDYSLGEQSRVCADRVEHLLKRMFVLDCVIRTEGHYPVPLAERDIVEDRTNLDIPALYDASIVQRLEAYETVPDEVVEALMPMWHRTTYTRPTSDAVELLPYLVNDLSLLRIKQREQQPEPTEEEQEVQDALDSFLRRASSDAAFVRSTGTREVYRGTGSDQDNGGSSSISTRGIPGVGEYISLPETNTLEKSWIGEETPIHGSKLHPAGFANETPEVTDGFIEITVVCNDTEMREEWDAISEIYGNRKDILVDATCEFEVSTDELRDILARDTDIVHYIGHIDGSGFKCPDGILDATTLSNVGATIVFLNGCRSHNQGVAVLEAGANATVSSLGDVGNTGAMEVGETLARLLYRGFSVGSAMSIVEEYTTIGRNYVVIGDPGVAIAQCENGLPLIYYINNNSGEVYEDEYTFEPYVYPISITNIGSIFQSYLPDLDQYYVGVGICGESNVSKNTFQSILPGTTVPLIEDGNLVWSHNWL